MYIISISNQKFKAKNFRLPLRYEIYDGIGKNVKELQYGKYVESRAKYVKEYTNPNAKALYEKGKKAENIGEKITLFKSMGPCQIKRMTFAERIKDSVIEFFERYFT